MSRFIKSGRFQSIKDAFTGGLKLPDGTTAQRHPDPYTGEIRYNTTNGKLEYYDGSQYVSIGSEGNVTITKDSFTGDGSTLVFTMSQVPADENNILVFVGNVHQNPDVAYTVAGTTLTFTTPPPGGQTIIVLFGFDSTVTS